MIKPGFRLDFVTEDGRVFTLHNPPTKAIVGMRGFGFSEMGPTTIKYPYQHGSTLLSKKLDPRKLDVTLRISKDCYDEYQVLRAYLLDTFRENRSYTHNPSLAHLIYYYVDNGVYRTREIDVFFSGKMTLDRPQAQSWDQFSFTETLEFVAPYPVWYDPTEVTTTFSTWTTEATLPITAPYVFGCKRSSANITYLGTWETFPKIRLEGTFTNISVINADTDQRIDFAGNGSSVTIDLQTGPQLYAENYYTHENYLANFSGDLTSFCLQTSPPVTANTIQVYAEGMSTTGKVYLIYKTSYRGI